MEPSQSHRPREGERDEESRDVVDRGGARDELDRDGHQEEHHGDTEVGDQLIAGERAQSEHHGHATRTDGGGASVAGCIPPSAVVWMASGPGPVAGGHAG